MSTALALAGVTAVLRGVLASWLSEQNANAALGGANAEVTAVAPDTIELTGTNAGPRLNLFLHHVTPNPGWRNVDLPSMDGDGRRVSNPPLALDLHYMLTAYGPAELQAEVLLGYGMQRLHQMPVLGRAEIEARLPQPLRRSQLGRQVEMIRVTPEPLGTEELSKLWTALQARYRPSSGYHVSVVLIETAAEARSPRPVLSRGARDPLTGRERGVVASAALAPGVPDISGLEMPSGQAGAMLGDTIEIEGTNLAGGSHTAILESRLLDIRREIAAIPAGGGLVRVTLPSAVAQLAAGVFSVRLRLVPPGAADPTETNELPMLLLPKVQSATSPVNRDAQGDATVDLQVRPQVRPHQRVSLIIGTREIPATPRTSATASLSFDVPAVDVGTYLVGLRVDGIESPRVDRSVSPPAFLGVPVVVQ